MPLLVESFNSGFQKLCDAYGKSYSKGQARVYFEELEEAFEDSSHWSRTVNSWIQHNPAFPKISDLLARTGAKKVEADHDLARTFIAADCVVQECRGGLIFTERSGQRSVTYRCPVCDRAYEKCLPRYQGPVHRFSEEEMAERRRERIRIARGYAA